MGSTTAVSLQSYLETSYRPDCDYLEGEIRERNLGERPHAKLQQFFILMFSLNEEAWGIVPLPEQRVQVRQNRYRVPDVCVVRNSDPDASIVTVPPLLCVEILSSKDTLASMQERIDDYVAMGVEHIWVVDPWKRLAYYGRPDGYIAEETSLNIPGTAIAISVPELFARLDRK